MEECGLKEVAKVMKIGKRDNGWFRMKEIIRFT
jgi:hypothetical protein